MRIPLGPTTASLVLCLALLRPALAADPDAALKADVDRLLQRLEASSHGLLKWDGAERMEYRREGDAAVAEIDGGRIRIAEPKADAQTSQDAPRITLGRLEIRRAPAADGAVAMTVRLPQDAVLHGNDGQEVKLALQEPQLQLMLEVPSDRLRDLNLGVAGVRLDDKKSGGWITFGPVAASYKVEAAADGSWTAPAAFELKGIEFFFPQGPAGGAIERISGHGGSAGPDLAGANKVRDRLNAMQQGDLAPADRANLLLTLLPQMLSAYSKADAEFDLQGLAVRQAGGEPTVGLAQASFGWSLSGLSAEAAALRVTLKHDGLRLAASVPNAERAPRHMIFDFGVENVSTAVLRTILEAAAKAQTAAAGADKQEAQQRVLAAAAMLDPVLRIYELAFDVADAAVDATATAKGSPLSPRGYSAESEVNVRGFDALAGLINDAPAAEYLPVLKEIGTPDSAPDGSPRLKFRLASAPPKWLTINGQDVSRWFAAGDPALGEPRLLRPASPAMQGGDVGAVQRSLASAKMPVPQTGVYDGATAAAVARFQKANGLNADGVVDAATRRKLGLKDEPALPEKPGRPAPRPH